VTDIHLKDIWFKVADGTRLHARHNGLPQALATPLICLPGLTRSTRDFAPVFQQVGTTRLVVALDFRGRGLSDRAAASTYRPQVEAADTIALFNHFGVQRAAVLGTSRGGIVGMVMANLYPERIAGLLLNDVGPVLEIDGLKRIIGHVGKSVSFPNWDAAAQALAWSSVGFDQMSDGDWLAAAHMIFADDDNRPCTDHDPHLAQSLPSAEDLEVLPLPDLWSLTDALTKFPAALLRGAGSDLLSAATVAKFKQRVANLVTHEVADRGHVPFLTEPTSIAAIADWLAEVDSTESRQRR
jgi:pimeloyl-ACP methyl ester carboxylesterase